MAVVAMGKAGGREMMAGSDLDLMFVYDHPPDVTESRGARTMAVKHGGSQKAATAILISLVRQNP